MSYAEEIRNQYQKLPPHKLKKMIAEGLPPVLYDLAEKILDEKNKPLTKEIDSSLAAVEICIQYQKLPPHKLKKMIAEGLPPLLYDVAQEILDEKNTLLTEEIASSVGIETPLDLEVTAVVRCFKCESSNTIGAAYCKSCGGKLNKERILHEVVKYCEQCGTGYEQDALYCEKDGTKLIATKVKIASTSPEPKVKESRPSTLLHQDETKSHYSTEVLNSTINSKPGIKDGKEVTTKKKGFVWGYVWVVMAYLSSFAMLAAGVSVSFDTGEPLLLFMGLLTLPAFFSGVGIHLKKRWGVVITNILLLIAIIGSIVELESGDDFAILKGIGQIVISMLWLKYFNSRWSLFH